MEVTDLKVVRYAVDGRVAIVTLDRPDRLNAWTGRMHTEYRWASPARRPIPSPGRRRHRRRPRVLRRRRRRAPSTATCEAGRYDPGTPDELARPGYGVRPEFDHAFAFHFGMRLPVIAAVNGPAAGVGLVLACFCDVRFAAAGRQAHDLGRPARPARRVRPVLGAPPARRRRPRRGPAPLEPGGAGRGGRQRWGW